MSKVWIKAALPAAAARARQVLACALCFLLVAVTAAFADAPVADSFPSTGAYTVKLKGTRNNVALVEMAGDYSRDTVGGKFNVEPRALIAKEFYKQYADRYDFIVVFSNFEFSTPGALAFYASVKNDTKGIGLPLFDNSLHFGSQGVLQGYIDMAALSRYVLDPSDPGFERAMKVLSHELLHRWAANVRYLDSNGTRSDSLLGKDGAHWSFLMDTGGSVEYGNRWVDNGNGTFTSKPDRQFFSPLDLYLMGMLKKEEVPPFFLIKSPGVSPLRLPEAGVTVTGTRETVTVDQIIAAEGVREPAADKAQKQFRIGYVLLTRPGVDATDEEIAGVNQVRLAFDTRLTALTGGQALAHTFLEPKSALTRLDEPGYGGVVVGAPGSTANLGKGLDWLRDKQQASGDWYDNPLTRLRDTTVAASAIADAGGSGNALLLERASNWLTAQAVSNTDYVARRIQALGTKAAESDWNQLVGMQNADGGWGAAPGYQSTPLDTALAVIALALDPNSNRQTLARDRAKVFLIDKQNPDGGWSHAVSGVSRAATTAHVVQALASLDGSSAQIATAATFLAARQNSDGGFGDSPSTIHDTANVMLSLAATGQLGAVRPLAAFDFLNATQQADGSWDGSVYATALAMRSLGTAQTYNWTASTFTAAPSPARDGQRVALSLWVKNTSTVAAPATTVKVFDGDPSAAVVLTEIPVPPLAPGLGAVIRGIWSTADTAGEHVLTAVIDPSSAASELTRADNTATARVTVLPATVQADLVVTAADVAVLPSVINRLPFTVSVLAQISNIGKTDALGVKVRLLSGPRADALTVVDEKIINLIGRSTVPVATSFEVTQPGRQIVAVVVDPDNLVADFDRSNNRADTAIETVSSLDLGVYAFDLVVPGAQATLGSDVELKATLHNFGTADSAPFQAVMTVSDGTTVREIGRPTVQLTGGSKKTFTLPWRVDLTGNLTFKVVLDPAATLADIDRSNNEASTTFTAGAAPAGPNLAVSFQDFLMTPDPADEGRPLTLTATIRNTGTLPATGVEYGFYEGDPATTGVLLAPLQTLATIAAGGSVQVDVTLSKLVGDAERVYFIAVDPANKITEAKKDDNSAFRVVEVKAMADLAVSSGNITLSPVAPKPGDALTVTVEVQNLGQQAAAPVLVRLLDGGTVLGDKVLTSLAAQSKGSVSFNLTLPAAASASFLTVVVDPENDVLEGNKSNNTATRSLTVQSGSAFVSEPFFSPNGDMLKDTVSFGFRISNPLVTQVQVINEGGAVVRTFTGLGAAPQMDGSVTWDGRDDFLRIVNDGTYRFRAVGVDGLTALAETSVVLDTNRTPVLRASGTPAEYYRNYTCRVPSFQDWATTLDEQSLFVTSLVTDVSGIYRIAIQGGEVSTVVPTAFVQAGRNDVRSVSASGRGEQIAFVRNYISGTGAATKASLEVWTAKGDGTGLLKLATNENAVAPENYYYISNLLVTHDGGSVIAGLNFPDGSFQVRRYPVDPALGAMKVLFSSKDHSSLSVSQMAAAPNRRRALMALWNTATGRPEMAVLDFETGAFISAPAGLYPAGYTNFQFKWSPDSSRFVLYAGVDETGVEAGNDIDYSFDVFDASYKLVKRFRTEKKSVATGNNFYGGNVSDLDWASAADEFAFSFDPMSGIGAPSNEARIYRADITNAKLTELPYDASVFRQYSQKLWWAPNDRAAMTEIQGYVPDFGYRTDYQSIHLDTGAVGALFPAWWAAAVNPNKASMSAGNFAPSGRRLYFTSDRDSANTFSACYSPTGGYQLFGFESLHNLVADLQPLRDPRVGGLVMRGTAADINFAGYQLDYADVKTPNNWLPIAVPGTEQKIGANLANWVPPGFGTYLARLTVTDLAGNSTVAQRRVNWSDTPAITDILKDFDYISPNGDGAQDQLKLSYKVLQPVRLAFEVKREDDGSRVRLVERDHASIGGGFVFEWDGRDDQARVVPDGKYVVRVLDYEFQVEVDNTLPQIELVASNHAFDYREANAKDLRFDSIGMSGSDVEVKFSTFEGKLATVSVLAAGRVVFKSAAAGPGQASVRWNGKDAQGQDVPSATYSFMIQTVETDGSEPEPYIVNAELNRAGGGLTLKAYPPLLKGTGEDSVDQLPFAARAVDRNFIGFESYALDRGWGDPPAVWDDVRRAHRYSLVEALDGTKTLTTFGSYATSLEFNGSRLRFAATDKAGNTVSVTSPHHMVQELVMVTVNGDYWVDGIVKGIGDYAGYAERATYGAYTTFSSHLIQLIIKQDCAPHSAFCRIPILPRHQLTDLRFSFQHNLPARAKRIEWRYAFVDSGKVPLDEEVVRLPWTTLVLSGGVTPPDPSMGVNIYYETPDRIDFKWKLPRPRVPGSLLVYQMVALDEDGQELRSNAYWHRYVDEPIVPQPAPAVWRAFHEPSLLCEAPPTQIAHVTTAVPEIGETYPHFVVGQRLYRLMPDGSRVLSYENLIDKNLGAALLHDQNFNTFDWPVGKHEFEFETLVQPGDLIQPPVWGVAARPHIYVNHTAPSVKINLPANGQKMCAARVPVAGRGTVGYVPMDVSVKETYAAYQDVQLQKPDGSWEHRGPVGFSIKPKDLLDAQGTSDVSLDPNVPSPICDISGACGNSGPVIWPDRPGQFTHATSAKLYGAGPNWPDQAAADALNGKITARLRAYGPSGHLSCTPVTVDVDGAVEGVSAIDRSLFSPNGDTVLDDVTATVSVLEALTVKVEVVRAAVDVNGRLSVLDDTPVAVVASGTSVLSGSHAFTWNGRDTNGVVVPDGVYAVRITLIDGCGNEKVELLQAEVDNTPPAIAVISPAANADVPTEFFIKGSVTDLHPLRYEVSGVLDSAPAAPIVLPNLGGMNQLNVNLASWNTLGSAGTAMVRVRAFDIVGNSSVVDVPVRLTGPVDIVGALNASPDPFSPNGDGRREKVSLFYTLTQAANITLELQRGAAKIKTLVSNQPTAAGNGVQVWDGTNTLGAVEGDGEITAVLTGEVIVAGSVTAREVARTTFVLDKTPPAITFTLPKGPVSSGQGGVVAKAADPLLSDANLAVSVNGAPFISLADAVDGLGALLAPLDALPEGSISLRVKAADRAENQSTATLNVVLDRTPPKVVLTEPKPNTFISGRKGLFSIEGGVEELNLARYQLLLGTTNVLLDATALPASPKLLAWNPLPVADGPYTLSLKADDQAGLVGQVDVPITVDNTPPVAAITATGSTLYVRVGGTVNGTATDVNLLNYRLELAPGGVTSSRWTEVARGSAAVSGGALATLSALPADGVYGMRLTVEDKAGNESAALQEVTVDTLAPQAPVLTAEIKNRRDADVKWTAPPDTDVAGYNLYRNGSKVNTALLTVPAHVDVGLASGNYSYTVKAVDRAGNEGLASNPGHVVVSSSEPVAQIFAPLRDGYASGVVDIRGTAMAGSDFKEYRVHFGAGAAPATWQLLRRSPLGLTADVLANWNTVGLVEGALYTLKLEAEDLSGVVATDQVTVKVKNTPPSAPLNLVGTLSVNDIALTWTANTEPDLQGYLLYRDGQLANAKGVVIGSLVPYLIKPTAYNDLAVPDGKHRYFVQAMDLAGNTSGPSNEVDFTVDTRPPHVTVTKPADGSKVGQSATLIAESPDSDLKLVQFQYKEASSSTWLDVGAPLTQNAGPWSTAWSLTGLPYGNYHVRALGTDDGNKTDPAPGFITLVVTDVRKPDAPTTLAASVTGGDVALSWVASASSFAVGYHIDRIEPDSTVTRLTTTPLNAVAYTDAARPDASYTYRVLAVSAGGTESDASNDAPAVVFTPLFEQPYTPTPDAVLPLQGQTLVAHTVTVRLTGGADVAVVASDAATGRYRFDTIPLAQGDNRFEVIARDAQGNTSKPAGWHAVRGLVPAAPTGLSAAVAASDVTLSWAANTEPDLAGYVPVLNGLPRTAAVVPASALASSTYYALYYGADKAIDGNASTAWLPDASLGFAGQWLEARLAAPSVIDSVSLNWASHAIPKRSRIEGFDGEVWVPLAELEDTTGAALVNVKLARTYRTDRLRVFIVEALNGVQLNEVKLNAHSVTTARSATFTGLPDGRPEVGVAAVSNLGFASPEAKTQPAVGDVTAPDAPVLSGLAVLSDAQLSWTIAASADLAGFEIFRDGVRVKQLANGTLRSAVDAALANGRYVYTIKALDGAGNASAASNDVTVDITVMGPTAPVTAAATAPIGGGLVDLSWTIGTGALPAAYTVHRATVAGGPYDLVASGLTGQAYADRGVANGTRYFYVVKGVDLVGNVGSTSNEVSATPEDRSAPGTPFFVLPGRSPGPVLTADPKTDLVGYAEPGSRVVVSRGSTQIGSVVASLEPLNQPLAGNGSAGYFDMTPDGSLVYYRSGSAAVRKADGTVVPATALANNVDGLRFAPDGQSAALVRYDNATGRNLLFRWNREADTAAAVQTLSQLAVFEVFGFSPDGNHLVANAYDFSAGQPGLVIVPWQGGATRFLSGSFTGAAWSPDGQTLAVTSPGALRLLDAALTSDVSVPGVVNSRAPSWLPDGSALLFERGGSLGSRAIARVDMPLMSVTTLADEAGVAYTSPVASPEGDAYLARRDQQLVQRSFSGAEEVLSGESYAGYGAPVWARSRTIAYLRNYGELILRTPAGRFSLPDAVLSVGANVFGAHAVDGRGNTSAPAAALEVRRLSDALPDWSINGDSWIVFPATPQAGEATDVTLTVRNLGALAPATLLSVAITDEQGVVTRLFDGSLNELNKDSQQTISMKWTPTQAGRYTLSAAVDASGQVDEAREDNNLASRQLFVTAAGGRPELQVRTDKATYLAAETVTTEVIAVNPGAQFDGSVVTRVTDLAGAELFRFEPRAVAALRFGFPQTLSFAWPSGTTLAGSYRVTSELLAADGQSVTTAAAGFAIAPQVTLSSSVLLDRAGYTTGEAVNLRGTVRFVSGNVTTLDAPAVLSILSATGDTVATKTVDLKGLLSVGGEVLVDLNWPAASPAGAYVASLTVGADSAPALTQAQAPFTVAAPAVPLVAGRLVVLGDVFATTETISSTVAITNAGAPVSPLSVRVRAFDTASNQTLATWGVDMAGVGSTATTASAALTGTWPLGSFDIRLEALVGGNWVLLDRALVQATERTPPGVAFTAPAPGAVVRSSATVKAFVTARQTAIAKVELSAVPDIWTLMSPAGAPGSYSANTLPAADGPVTLQLRASDTLSNVSAPVSLAIVIDNTPPSITVTGVVPGGSVTGTATPVVAIADLHLETTEVLLDGAPFVSGTAVSANGNHTLSVKAVDRAGNESQQTVAFKVDSGLALTGALVVSPDTVAIGETVTLDARLSNGAAATLNGVQVKLEIRDRASGTLLQSFSDVATVAPGAAGYQRAWSWTAAGTAGALLDVALTATVDGTALPIATGTLQLGAPNASISLEALVAGPKKLLVYVRCTRLEDETWDNCAAPNRAFSNAATVSACTSDRAAWLGQYLAARGIDHTLVTDEASFLREMRSGLYSTYWIGGGALKLGSLAAAQVQAAVQRGDTLLTEGWTAGRNPVLDLVSSVGFLGKWSSLQASITTTGTVLPAATLVTNTPVRLSSTTGTRHATLNNGHGIVSGTYGLGRTMAFAFDLSGTLRQATENTLPSWNSVVSASLQSLVRTAPLALVGGGVFDLKATVGNAGASPQLLDHVARLPAQAQVLQTAPAATASTVEGGLPTLRWRATAAAGGTLNLGATARAPLQEGDYVVSSLVNQVNADGSATLLQDQTVALRVDGPIGLTDTAFTHAQAIVAADARLVAKTSALNWLTLAKMSIADGRWHDALRQLAAAQSAAQSLQGGDADAARLAIARAIEAVEKRL